VVTGGSAVLDGLLEVADEIFAAPIRIGNPFGAGGLIDKVNTPDFSTSVGLLKYGLLDLKDRGMIKNQPKGVIYKIKEWFGF
jgi:cell division protein FtsA